MRLHVLERTQFLPLSPEDAWSFFSSPRNLDAITPPELGFQITSCLSETMHPGQIITYKVRLAPLLWVPWVTEIKEVEPLRSFVDEQRFGPYRFWHHRHTFEPTDSGVLMRDTIHYALGFGPLGSLAHALFVRPKLERIFNFRKTELERRFPKKNQRPQLSQPASAR